MSRTYKTNAKQAVNTAWLAVSAQIRSLDSRVTIKPKMSADIFVIDDNVQDGIHFEIKPIVLRVPQRINSKRSGCLYIVIKGKIVFALEQRDGRFTTSSFATNIGYFRETDDQIQHVYGAHFDFSPNSVAHPVFHSQIATHADLFQAVQAQHHNVMELKTEADLMSRVLRNVRLPTAQMDFFAVLLQVCSDHLINEMSESSKLFGYEKLRDASSFFFGYGVHAGLRNSSSSNCYRSPYWYDHSHRSPAPS